MTAPQNPAPLDVALEELLEEIVAEHRRWNIAHGAAWVAAMVVAVWVAAHRGHWGLLVGSTTALGAIGLTLNHLHNRAAQRAVELARAARRCGPGPRRPPREKGLL